MVTSGANASIAHMGRLSDLLAWHAADPVDAREQARNDVIASHQGNRNPFIDHPEWVNCLFAAECAGGGIPAAPSGLQALSTNGPVELDWDDNSESDLAGYRLIRTQIPSGPSITLHGGLLASSHFTDVSAQIGGLYAYSVTAEDLDGDESAPSAELSVSVSLNVATLPWINEIHYDNASTDVGEGFEIAGPAGLDLSGWQAVTYNGNGGGVTAALGLSGVLNDDGSGFGFRFVPRAGLQNGPADALALVDPEGVVVEFLSYEGVVRAIGGAADGMLSSDIGVSEGSSVPTGYSLQRQGNGSQGSDFTWTSPGPNTQGTVNMGQTLSAPVPVQVPGLSLWAMVAGATLLLISGARLTKPS